MPANQWAGPLQQLSPAADLNVYSNYSGGRSPYPCAGYILPTDGAGVYGYRWQCTELAVRVADVEWGVGGNARWASASVGGVRWSGAAKDMYRVAPALQLTQYPNGGGMAPRFGDLLVMRDSSVGHVAVVAAVTTNAVLFAGENQGDGLQSFPLSGSMVRSTWGGYSVIGWLRGKGSVQAPPPPPQMYSGFVNHAYQDVLGRPADSTGLNGSTSALAAGTSRTQVALALSRSPEFGNRTADVIFQTYLHRTPGSAGEQWISGALQSGASIEQMRAAVIGSDEYFQTRAGSSSSGYVTALFGDVLHRSVDANANSYWVSQLSAGKSRQQVALEVLTSSEGQTVLVNDMFQQYLRRPGGTSNPWVAFLQQGHRDEELIAELLGSDEYEINIALVPFEGRVYQDVLGRPIDVAAATNIAKGLMNGGSTVDFAHGVATSREFDNHTADVIFQTYLHRTPGSAGEQWISGALQSGASIEQMKAAVIGSDEYFQTRAGSSSSGYVTALFGDVLHRSVDANANSYWVSQLSAGKSRQQVALEVLTSSEGQTVLVNDMFQQYLRRPGGTSNPWVAFLQQGHRDEELIAQLLGSEEYAGRLS